MIYSCGAELPFKQCRDHIEKQKYMLNLDLLKLFITLVMHLHVYNSQVFLWSAFSLFLFFFNVNSYEEDVWTEIAKFLDGRSLVMLAATCKWFSRIMMEDSVWKYACLRDLQVPDPGDVAVKWIKLYAAAFGIIQLLWFLIQLLRRNFAYTHFKSIPLQMEATHTCFVNRRSILVMHLLESVNIA